MDSADEPSLFATPTSAADSADPVAEQTAQPEPEPQPRAQTPPLRVMTPGQQRSEVQAVRREAEALHDTARQIERQMTRRGKSSPSDAGAAAAPRPLPAVKMTHTRPHASDDTVSAARQVALAHELEAEGVQMQCTLRFSTSALERAKPTVAKRSSQSHRPRSPPLRKAHRGRTGPGLTLHSRYHPPPHGTTVGHHSGGTEVTDKLTDLNRRIKELERQKAALEKSRNRTASGKVALKQLGKRDWPGTVLHELATCAPQTASPFAQAAGCAKPSSPLAADNGPPQAASGAADPHAAPAPRRPRPALRRCRLGRRRPKHRRSLPRMAPQRRGD